MSRGFCGWGIVAIEQKRHRLIVKRQRYLVSQRILERAVHTWRDTARRERRAADLRRQRRHALGRQLAHRRARWQRAAIATWRRGIAFVPPPPLEAIEDLVSRRVRATNRLIVARIATLKRERNRDFLARDAFEAWRAIWRRRAHLRLDTARVQKRRDALALKHSVRGWRAEVERKRAYRCTLHRGARALANAARDAAHATTTRRSAFLAWKLFHTSHVELRLSRWDASVRIASRLRRLRGVVVAAARRRMRLACRIWRGDSRAEGYAAMRVTRTLGLARPLIGWRQRRQTRDAIAVTLRRSLNIAVRRERQGRARVVLRLWRRVARVALLGQGTHAGCVVQRRRRRRIASCWTAWRAELCASRRWRAELKRLARTQEVRAYRRMRTLFVRQVHRHREGALALDTLEIIRQPLDDQIMRHSFRVWRAAVKSAIGNALGHRLLRTVSRARTLERCFANWKVFALRMFMARARARRALRKMERAWERGRTCALRTGLGRWRRGVLARRTVAIASVLVARAAEKQKRSAAFWALRAWSLQVDLDCARRLHGGESTKLRLQSQRLICSRVGERLLAIAFGGMRRAWHILKVHGTVAAAREHAIVAIAAASDVRRERRAFKRLRRWATFARRLERTLGRLKDARGRGAGARAFRRFRTICAAAKAREAQEKRDAARKQRVKETVVALMHSAEARARHAAWLGWTEHARAQKTRRALRARVILHHRRRVCAASFGAWATRLADRHHRDGLLLKRVATIERAVEAFQFRRFAVAVRRSERTPAVVRRLAARAVANQLRALQTRFLHRWHAAVSKRVICKHLVAKMRGHTRGETLGYFFRQWSVEQHNSALLRRGAGVVLRRYVASKVHRPMRAALRAWRLNLAKAHARGRVLLRAGQIGSRVLISSALRHWGAAAKERAKEVAAWRVVMRWKANTERGLVETTFGRWQRLHTERRRAQRGFARFASALHQRTALRELGELTTTVRLDAVAVRGWRTLGSLVRTLAARREITLTTQRGAALSETAQRRGNELKRAHLRLWATKVHACVNMRVLFQVRSYSRSCDGRAAPCSRAMRSPPSPSPSLSLLFPARRIAAQCRHMTF